MMAELLNLALPCVKTGDENAALNLAKSGALAGMAAWFPSNTSCFAFQIPRPQGSKPLWTIQLVLMV
eukprot:m.230940 g.230940  ORF g.230940 m.230940 type:complete len:67 (+) comp17359_c0_seq8:4695-4895(+)